MQINGRQIGMPVHNIGLPQWRVKCFYDTFVLTDVPCFC